MIKRSVTLGLLVASAIALGAAGRLHGAKPADKRDYTDFEKSVTRTDPSYAAELAPASKALVKEYRIPVFQRKIQIDDGVWYDGWTFGGTVPGPTIHVRQGDHVRIRFINKGNIPHSIDFHAQRTAMNTSMRDIMPGDSLAFDFIAKDPGAFMVHCTTQPVVLHVMQGMFLPMIVDPTRGWGTHVDKEFVLVQNEFYEKDGAAGHPKEADWPAAMDKRASHVVFNGRAFQYRANPLKVRLGDRVRLFVINAGPNFTSNFHLVGGMFDRVYPGGVPAEAITTVQTWPIPPGGSAIFETTFDPAGGPGTYPFVSHSFSDAYKGATGYFQVSGLTAVASAH